MQKCKITVLKCTVDDDLAVEFVKGEKMGICPVFSEGQEFVTQIGGQVPAGFCMWAWDDIFKNFQILMRGGSFKEWMKDENTIIACCTDAFRPVVFKLERIED